MDPRKDFPGNGTRFPSEIRGRTSEGSGASDPNDFLSAACRGQTTDVEKGHIHGDAAKNGAELTLDEGVAPGGEGSGKPVGVPGGNGCNLEIAGGTKGCTVANRFPPSNGTDNKDAGFPGENGF